MSGLDIFELQSDTVYGSFAQDNRLPFASGLSAHAMHYKFILEFYGKDFEKSENENAVLVTPGEYLPLLETAGLVPNKDSAFYQALNSVSKAVSEDELKIFQKGVENRKKVVIEEEKEKHTESFSLRV